MFNNHENNNNQISPKHEYKNGDLGLNMSIEMSKALNHMANAKTIDELRKNIYETLPSERQVFAKLEQWENGVKKLEILIPYTREELLDSQINFFSTEKKTWIDPQRAKCFGLDFDYNPESIKFEGSTYAPTHRGLDKLLEGFTQWKDFLEKELNIKT